MSLGELKAENAKLEVDIASGAAAEAEDAESDADEVEEGAVGDVAEQTEGESKTESEDWMKADNQESEGSDSVPLAALVKTRTKLKGTIKEQSSEIDQLKREIEGLRKIQTQPALVQHDIKPPTPDQFNYDEVAFAKAQNDFIEARINAGLMQVTQKTEQQKQAELARQKLDEALNSHYSRAENLIKTAGITEQDYQSADTKLRVAVDQVMPGRGDIVVDALLANLGEGSEKVSYWLGINATAREELQRKLIADPSGLSVAMWLGKKVADLSPPTKIRSSAPKPTTQLTGDGNSRDPHKALKDKLNKARASGDMQKVIDLRAEAKRLGVDPKTL